MRLAILGNIGGGGYKIGKYLRERGVDVHLYPQMSTGPYDPRWEDQEYRDDGWVTFLRWDQMRGLRRCTSKLWLLWHLRSQGYDALITMEGMTLYAQFTGIPYLAMATGADITFVAPRRDLHGWGLRRAYRKAALVHIGTYNTVEAKRFRLPHVINLPQLIETEKYRPAPSSVPRPPVDLVFFNAARLSWPDKGTDKFLRAFARFTAMGPPAHLYLVEWGDDVARTVALVDELGLRSRVTFLAPLTKADLVNYFNMADIVVDQFCDYGPGYAAMEAMACGKPVMMYINSSRFELFYAETPPIFNCFTEDEILSQLLAHTDPAKLRDMGQRAREWVLYHLNLGRQMNRLIFHLETMTGKEACNRCPRPNISKDGGLL